MSDNFEEFILKADELPILLNILFFKGNISFKIHPYVIRKDIFGVSLEEQVIINLLIDKENYNANLPRQTYSQIIPVYSSLRDILIASGFLKMNNWDILIAELNRIMSIDPLQGERFTFVGMDTNCYINRVYSVLKNSYKGNISSFFFVLSRIIHLELRAARNISDDQLDALKEDDFYKGVRTIFNEFWHGDRLFARKKHIGRIEFNKLQKQSKCLINQSLELNNNIDNDIQIIEDFRKQIIKQNYDLLMITSDKHVEDLCREGGVKCISLKSPKIDDLPTNFVGNWHQLCDFLYLNAIYFGALSFRGTNNTIQMYGLWRGKSVEDWDTESIKVRIGSKNLIELLDQQLNII